jgi:aspartyl-tRNA(Asn)/glutamyl-tRNA(Gln) amidotransferase subunit C
MVIVAGSPSRVNQPPSQRVEHPEPLPMISAMVRAMSSARISLEEAQHVARLARLKLTAAELEGYRAQLDDILTYVASLDALNVDAVEPTFHPVELAAPKREDRVADSLAREEVLAQAPAAREGGFEVPKVLEGE